MNIQSCNAVNFKAKVNGMSFDKDTGTLVTVAGKDYLKPGDSFLYPSNDPYSSYYEMGCYKGTESSSNPDKPAILAKRYADGSIQRLNLNGDSFIFNSSELKSHISNLQNQLAIMEKFEKNNKSV